MPFPNVSSTPNNVSLVPNHGSSQSKEMRPGFHQIMRAGQSPATAKSEAEQRADFIIAQTYKMEAILIKFSDEWRNAKMDIATKSFNQGAITKKKHATLCLDAHLRSGEATKEALKAANKAAQEPIISSMFTKLGVTSQQNSHQIFFAQLVQAGIITKE